MAAIRGSREQMTLGLVLLCHNVALGSDRGRLGVLVEGVLAAGNAIAALSGVSAVFRSTYALLCGGIRLLSSFSSQSVKPTQFARDRGTKERCSDPLPTSPLAYRQRARCSSSSISSSCDRAATGSHALTWLIPSCESRTTASPRARSRRRSYVCRQMPFRFGGNGAAGLTKLARSGKVSQGLFIAFNLLDEAPHVAEQRCELPAFCDGLGGIAPVP
jgi:hypothetical protein